MNQEDQGDRMFARGQEGVEDHKKELGEGGGRKMRGD